MNRPTDELRDLIERALRDFEISSPSARRSGVVDDWRQWLAEACDRIDGAGMTSAVARPRSADPAGVARRVRA